MMVMKSVFWWRKPEYPEETTDLRQVTDLLGMKVLKPVLLATLEFGLERVSIYRSFYYISSD